LADGVVSVDTCQVEENLKVKRLKTPDGPITRQIAYRDWRITGRAGDADAVEVAVNDAGRIIFGRCTCDFFQEHLMNQGPCEHILALFQASAELRVDGASSS